MTCVSIVGAVPMDLKQFGALCVAPKLSRARDKFELQRSCSASCSLESLRGEL